jgi:DNA topoisomerase-1
MTKTLVIVESPGKIKTISSYLGDNYIVKASFGHCRDLDKNSLSIEIENNFNPLYITIPDKKKIVNDLKYIASTCSEVILASDEDREGEMIASSLKDLLNLDNPKRIVFNEITKKAINYAISNPTTINNNMVLAQQTRRLLDRLVGYKISPLLWKKIEGQSSAGRVQSVVIKIIIDKEKEIEKSISEPYFKTTTLFKYNKHKLNTVLMLDKEQYKFTDEKDIKLFLNKFNNNIVCKVVNVIDKEINRSPPPPFTTSTLTQEASTKLKFNTKKTMDLAQKLYEAGMITYMRTDSTIISQDAINICKKYIIENYGEYYYTERHFKNKSKNAQEAHEAIRPTKLNICDYNNLGIECQNLYSLIWKRTIASLMSDAKILIKSIYINIYHNQQSILPNDTLFNTNIENIMFDGYLLLYNNYETENEISKINIDINTIIDFDNIKISQEYTKPPLRYNEAGLIKFLEKNSIGRPSTYASIMSKIIDKNYVKITNIDGVSKDSKQFSIIKSKLNKSDKIKEEIKQIIIGSEKQKLVPTDIGIKINDFLCEYFNTIMDITFTAKMEKLLDKIANGKAIWYSVLDAFYQTFNPMCEKLTLELKKNEIMKGKEKLIGIHPETNENIYSMIGKYGLCVKMKDGKDFKFAPIKDCKQEDITLDMAISVLQYPKYLGKIDKKPVYLCKGQYGFYYKVGKDVYSIKEDKELTLDYCKIMMNNRQSNGAIKTFNIKGVVYNLRKGQYGYYLQILNNNKPKNIPLGKEIDEDKLTEQVILDYIYKN